MIVKFGYMRFVAAAHRGRREQGRRGTVASNLPGLGICSAVVLLLTLTSGSPRAQAGGFTIPLIGSRAATTGGFVAKPDDTTAMYHNPAGLSLLGPYQVDLAATALLTHSRYYQCRVATFDAAGNPTGCAAGEGFQPPVKATRFRGLPGGFGALPFLGLAGRFGLRRWNFGLAVYSPLNAIGAFPDCQRAADGRPLNCDRAPQRFHAVQGSINTLFITPTVAYEPHPAIAIGVSVSAVWATMTNDMALWLGGPNSAVALLDDGWGGEGRMQLEAKGWSWAVSVGILWNIGETFAPQNRWLKGLRIGVAYSSPVAFRFNSRLRLISPLIHDFAQESADCLRGSGDTPDVRCRGKLGLTFPMQLRVGVSWEITREWQVGADVMWQNYRIYDAIKVSLSTPLVLDVGLGDPISVQEQIEPKESSDCVTVTAGGQYSPRWAPGLELRLGFYFDQSPYPDRTFSLMSADSDKYGIGFGVGYRFRFGLEVSFGYMAIFFRDRHIRDSILRPRICPDGDATCQGLAPDADFSMNGNYQSRRVDTFTLQLGWRFGGGKKPLKRTP